MLQVAALKSALRAPEGKWAASSERRATINYSPDLPVQLRCGWWGAGLWRLTSFICLCPVHECSHVEVVEPCGSVLEQFTAAWGRMLGCPAAVISKAVPTHAPPPRSLAVLHDDGDEAPTEFLIFSAQNFLHICYPAALDRVCAGPGFAVGCV